MRIGVIEDNPSISGLLKERLELAGHEVLLYREGWTFLEQHLSVEELAPLPTPFDVILVDLLLPGGVSGVQIISEARKDFPDLRIVVISAVPSWDLENVTRSYPGVKALQKPFTLRDLITAIEE